MMESNKYPSSPDNSRTSCPLFCIGSIIGQKGSSVVLARARARACHGVGLFNRVSSFQEPQMVPHSNPSSSSLSVQNETLRPNSKGFIRCFCQGLYVSTLNGIFSRARVKSMNTMNTPGANTLPVALNKWAKYLRDLWDLVQASSVLVLNFWKSDNTLISD